MFIASVVSLIAFKIYETKASPVVICIIGTSSAGKSSMVQDLVYQLKNYHMVSVDEFNMEAGLERVARTLGWDGNSATLHLFMDDYVMTNYGTYMRLVTELTSGHELQKSISRQAYAAFFEYAEQEAQKSNVLIDTTFDFSNNYDQLTTIMKGKRIIKVLLYCPADILLERVAMRNKSENLKDRRTALNAFWQFAAFYKLHESDSEQVVDTISRDIMLSALKKAVDDFIAAMKRYPPEDHVMENKQAVAVADLQYFYEAFIKKFKLDELQVVTITPMHRYDILLNSTKSPSENSQIILHYLTKHAF